MRPPSVPFDEIDTTRAGARVSLLSAHEIVEWSSNMFGDGLVLTTSFGIQSAVMLHLAAQVTPEIPIVWIVTNEGLASVGSKKSVGFICRQKQRPPRPSWPPPKERFDERHNMRADSTVIRQLAGCDSGLDAIQGKIRHGC